MTVRQTLKAVLAAALVAAAGSALAADSHPDVSISKGYYKPVSGVQIGTLRCESAGAIGYVVGSEREMSCEYRPKAGRHAVDLYIGRFDKLGVDLGATGSTVLAWAVVAHSRDLGPGDLAGRYTGASASIAAGIGGGANVLVGGSDITVTLQPLSVEGQTGLSVAAGLSRLTLDPI